MRTAAVEAPQDNEVLGEYGKARADSGDLSQAKDALSSQDLSQAENRFELAYQTFNQGQQQIQDSGQLLNGLLSLIPQKQDADRLIEAAGLISAN